MFSSGVGVTHRAAVKAWKEGREFHRRSGKYAYIDVEQLASGMWAYRIFNNTIALRLPEELRAREVANKLRGDTHLPVAPVFAFVRATPTTAVHLEALGIDAYCGRKDHPPTMFGREVDPAEFYSIEQIMQKPVWTPPPKRPRNVFVNLTMPLFGHPQGMTA